MADVSSGRLMQPACQVLCPARRGSDRAAQLRLSKLPCGQVCQGHRRGAQPELDLRELIPFLVSIQQRQRQ